MKIIGGRTKIDISPGRNVPHFTGGNGNFSTKNEEISIFVYISFVENLTIYCHNFYAFFDKKKTTKNLKNQICFVTPVVTVFIF